MKGLFKAQGKIGLFDNQFSKQKLKDMGNPLEDVSNIIDFEMFRFFLKLSC